MIPFAGLLGFIGARPAVTAGIGAGLLAALIAAGLYGGIQALRLKNTQADLRLEQADHAVTQGSLALLTNQVGVWKSAADRRQTEAAAALAKARAANAARKTAEAALAAWKPTGDECEDLRSIIDLARDADRVQP